MVNDVGGQKYEVRRDFVFSPQTSDIRPQTSILMKLLTHIPSWLKNKYLLTLIGFVVWMLFFDERDFFTIGHYKQELKDLQQSKNYYMAEIKANQDKLHITTNTLEKIAREKYYMKRDNEDLFLIQSQKQ